MFRARRGWQRSGVPHRFAWSAAEESRLVPEGSYEIRVTARDQGGNRLARVTTVQRPVEQPPTPAVTGHHVFPVAGPYSFGGADARFGAARTGTPTRARTSWPRRARRVVAPAAGVITLSRQYQASGAGYYVVLHADNEPYDYVFMHLQSKCW